MKQLNCRTVLDSVLKLTRNTVFEIDSNFIFTQVHVGKQDDLLLQQEFFIGKRIMDVVPAAHWQRVETNFEKTRQTGECIYFTYPSFEKDDPRWFSASLQYISPAGSEAYFLLCIMDTTAQKKAEEGVRFHAAFEEQMIYATSTLLQSTEESFDEAVNAVLYRIGSFFGIDRSYLFMFNSGRTEMNNTHEWCSEGTSPEKENLQNLPLDIFPEWMRVLGLNQEVHIADVGMLPESWVAEKKILEAQHIRSLLALPVTASGTLFGFIGFDAVKQHVKWDTPQRQLLQLLADNIGSVIHRLQQSRNLRDISERAQELAEMANRANRYKSDFLANMSHEMRTPLHGVLGFTDVLMQSGLKPVQEQYLGHLKDSAEIMLKVINQILDFSKIESGVMELIPVSTDVSALLTRCCKQISVTATAKQLTLYCNHDTRIPQHCLLDDLKLEQVLINLLGNAIKFTEHGSVELRTSLLGKDPVTSFLKVRFSIIDTGIGISAEQQQRIFQPFSQADTSISRKYGGTGLGLSISKQFISMMGSKLMLNSEPGKGSEFYFDLVLEEKAL